jgi:hypothetical protein
MAKITDKIEVLIQPVIEDMSYELVGVEYIASDKHSILRVYIEKSQLPKLKKGEHYWEDLIGLEVVNRSNVPTNSLFELGIILVELLSGFFLFCYCRFCLCRYFCFFFCLGFCFRCQFSCNGCCHF